MFPNRNNFKKDKNCNLSTNNVLTFHQKRKQQQQQQSTKPEEEEKVVVVTKMVDQSSIQKRIPFGKNVYQCTLSYDECIKLICQMKDYDQVFSLGKGCFGATYSVRPKFSNITEPVACKVFNFLQTSSMFDDQENICKYHLNVDDDDLSFNQNHASYLSEVRMLRSIGRHQHIIEFFDTFQLYHDPNMDEIFCIDGDEKYYGKKHKSACLDENSNNSGSGDFVRNFMPRLLSSAYLMAQHEINLYEWMQYHSMNSINELTLQSLFMQIGSAMEFLHECSFICHHDIKENNIVLHKNVPPFSRNFHFVLIDFGLALRYDKPTYERAQLHSEQVGSFSFKKNHNFGNESSHFFQFEDTLPLSDTKSSTFPSSTNNYTAFLDDSNAFGQMLHRIFEFEEEEILDKNLEKIINILAPYGGFDRSITISWALKKYSENKNERR